MSTCSSLGCASAGSDLVFERSPRLLQDMSMLSELDSCMWWCTNRILWREGGAVRTVYEVQLEDINSRERGAVMRHDGWQTPLGLAVLEGVSGRNGVGEEAFWASNEKI